MIGLRTLATAALFMAVGLAAAPVQAQPISASDPQTIAAFLEAEGLTVEVTKDKDGDPLIQIDLGEGRKFSVFFYNCTDQKDCRSIQFYAGFTDLKVDAAKINDWNRTRRFGRAYIDMVGDPVIEMDVATADGMPRALFAVNFGFWKALVEEFPAFIHAGK